MSNPPRQAFKRAWFRPAIDALLEMGQLTGNSRVTDFTGALKFPSTVSELRRSPYPARPLNLPPSLVVPGQLDRSNAKWLLHHVTYEREDAPPALIASGPGEHQSGAHALLPGITHVIETRFYLVQDEYPDYAATGITWLDEDGAILLHAVFPPNPEHPTAVKWPEAEWDKRVDNFGWVIRVSLEALALDEDLYNAAYSPLVVPMQA